MPLVVATLENALRSIFQNPPKVLFDTADKWAKAYADYAAQATTVPTPATPLFTGLEPELFRGTLIATWTEPKTGSPATAAQAFVTALTTFWTLPPVVFTAGADSGAPVAVPGVAGLVPCLTGIFANIGNTAETAAAGVAACLHAATVGIPMVLLPSNTPVTVI